MDQDVSVLEDSFHVLRVCYEIRRQVAFIELHTLYHFECGFDPFCLFHRDGTVLANLVHRVGDDFANRCVPVGRNGCDLSDLLPARNIF